MFFKITVRQIVISMLFVGMLAGCKSVQIEPTMTSAPANPTASPILPTSTTRPTVTEQQTLPTSALSAYAFPDSIDPAKEYLFYLHGKIIEDQGILAISPDFGEYEYEAILHKLSSYGFVVISEQRAKDTDGVEYAKSVAQQARALLNSGVPARNITILGASKGGGIGIYVSHFLENKDVNFVIMAICNPEEVATLEQNQIFLYGNVLSIYDSTDDLAGSCKDLFAFSKGKGIARYDEIVLQVGTGHGILFKPLDEWITPVVQWARNP
jgi:hypothetical protein